jgi:SNF2 family DNA or RNA helicase
MYNVKAELRVRPKLTTKFNLAKYSAWQYPEFNVWQKDFCAILAKAVQNKQFQIVTVAEVCLVQTHQIFHSRHLNRAIKNMNTYYQNINESIEFFSNANLAPNVNEFISTKGKLELKSPDQKNYIETCESSSCFIFPYINEIELDECINKFMRLKLSEIPKLKTSMSEPNSLMPKIVAMRNYLSECFLLSVKNIKTKDISVEAKFNAAKNRNLAGLCSLAKRSTQGILKSANIAVIKKIVANSEISENTIHHEIDWKTTLGFEHKFSQQLVLNCIQTVRGLFELGGDFVLPEFLLQGAPTAPKTELLNTKKVDTREFFAGDNSFHSKISSKNFPPQFLATITVPMEPLFLKPHTRMANTAKNELNSYDSLSLTNTFLEEKSEITSNLLWKTSKGESLENFGNSFFKFVSQLIEVNKTEKNLEFVKDELLFLPEFQFTIKEDTLSEDEFVSAKFQKIENSYLTPLGVVISKKEYEESLKAYLARKRALARFGEIGFSKIFKSLQAIENLENKNTSGGDAQAFTKLMNTTFENNFFEKDTEIVSNAADKIFSMQPCHPHATLWKYQAHGVAWILSRFKLGLGALVADEMGLGKTLMTIATVKILSGALKQPALILCPKSLVLNWLSEFKKFAPEIKVSEFEGASGGGFSQENKQSKVIVCGLHKFRAWRKSQEGEDGKNSLRLQFPLLVIDEAHQLKNSTTQISECVKDIEADNILALTGTPLENHIGELWNLVDLLNSGFLGSRLSFGAYVANARKQEKNSEKERLLDPLRQMLSFIMLRRTKKSPQVQLDLPEKVYSNHMHGLSQEQLIIYDSILELTSNQELLAKTSFGKRAVFLKALLHLKQVCVHPNVYLTGDEDDVVFGTDPDKEYTQAALKLRKKLQTHIKEEKKLLSGSLAYQKLVSQSEKITHLMDLLHEVKETENGILIFTQFISAAKLVQKILSLTAVEEWQTTEILDGQVSAPQRMKMVEVFQSKCSNAKKQAPPILILSLKAGGVGLNLTGASRVLHLDRWWNPAIEAQATDRAHRLGQKNTVFVHTFTAQGTVETGIDNLLKQKQSLMVDILKSDEKSIFNSLTDSTEGFWSLVDPHFSFRKKRKLI